MANTKTVTIRVDSTQTVKAGGFKVDVNLSDYHADSLVQIFEYGLARFYQDKVNSWANANKDKAGNKPTESRIKDHFAALVDAHKEGPLTRREAGLALTDVQREAIGLAAADVLPALGFKTMKDAATSKTADSDGNPWFVPAGAGGAANPVAMLAFIQRNPDQDYMGRAEAIIESRKRATYVQINL